MDKAIITSFMIIASVVCAMLVFNAVYPAVIRSSDAMVSMKGRVDDRLKSQIEIIHATGKSTDSDVSVWVKNIGSLRIGAVESCDVFFGQEGEFVRVPYGSGGPPHWEYTLENDTDWNPSATVKILIRYGVVSPDPGRHFLKVTTPNGVSDEYYFSIE